MASHILAAGPCAAFKEVVNPTSGHGFETVTIVTNVSREEALKALEGDALAHATVRAHTLGPVQVWPGAAFLYCEDCLEVEWSIRPVKR
jgi:hypothetical protein